MQLAADNNMADRAADLGEPDLPPAAAADGAHVPGKPLVIMTPSPCCAPGRSSPIAEFTRGEFKTVIGEQSAELVPEKVKRVVVCSGKVYYDLVRKREERKAPPSSRLEQLYPFPAQGVRRRLKKYPNDDRHRLVPGRAAEPGRVVLRPALSAREHERRPAWATPDGRLSASPAVGYAHLPRSSRRRCSTRRSAKLRASSLSK